MSQLAYCELGGASVLLDVRDVAEVADAERLSPDHRIVDVSVLLGHPERPAPRRALRLARCLQPTWLLVGAEVRFISTRELSAQAVPPFIASHLAALWIRGVATHGDKLAFELDGERLAAHFGGADP